MTWTLPEPMLAALAPDSALAPGWAAEMKWDGWRALLSLDAGHLVLRSRRGTNLLPSFPEVGSGAAQLPDATSLDGELVVWEGGRLAFERLQGRLQRRGAGAVRLAAEWPVHFVAFDVLRLAGTDTTGWPYRRRRAALEHLFVERRLTAPWALCPSTTDPATVREWLTSWTAVGFEGVVFKRLEGGYEPSVRGWRKLQGARHRGRRGRRVHGPAGRSPHAAAGPVRHRRATAVRRAAARPFRRPRAGRSPDSSPRPEMTTPGRAGRSVRVGARARACASPS
ncbi:hypothetical protein [Streptomyces sp. Tu 3180]|uniref:ATP-dependent DNA ligase n=1 Tax=Streptomyces sp. Tu 3180 TaxID=2682611 RepID=UPI0032607246